VLRSDGGVRRANLTGVVRGAVAVASQAATYAKLSPFVHPAIVNGVPGVIVAPRGKVYSIMAFTVHHGKIIAIDSLVDPDRLTRLDLVLPQA
jgi:RNA polymerase sigma-70 factor (ECF subfamily)